MNPIVYNKIIDKLDRLSEYYKILKEIQAKNEKSFLSDFHFFGLAERYLQLSIEILLDTGKMIISDKKINKPYDNQGVFDLLKENKIIGAELHAGLYGAAGLRNVLVHDYDKIDRKMIYNSLQERIIYFDQFKKEILKYLQKQRKK